MAGTVKIDFRRMVNNLTMMGNAFDSSVTDIRLKVSQAYVRHFKMSFKNHGVVGTSDEWAPRKRIYRDSNGVPYPNIMVRTGKLRDSITAELDAFGMINIRTRECNYAVYHNDPMNSPSTINGELSGWGYNVHRRFMGNSASFEKIILDYINEAVAHAMEYYTSGINYFAIQNF